MRVLPGGGCTIPRFRFSMTKQWLRVFRTPAFPMFGGSIEPGALPLVSMMLPNNAIDRDTVRAQLRAPYGARHCERWAALPIRLASRSRHRRDSGHDQTLPRRGGI